MKRGSVLMEFVLTMPILVTLMMLVFQFGLVWLAREQTAYAAYCAARSSLSYSPFERQTAANRAAYLALSWVHGASASGSLQSIPGWGQIPNSGGMSQWVSVRLQNPQGYCMATITYDFPLGIPVASRLIGGAVNSGTPVTRNGFPVIRLMETCVLPVPYSTSNLPIGGLL